MAYRILHLSDTHVGADGFDGDGVDAVASLDRMLADCRRLTDLDLVLVTGDIADDGTEAGCRQVRDRIGAFAGERGIPHVYSTGNHDRRPGFTAALGTGHRDAGNDMGRPLVAGDERAAVSTVDGLRVITLDSLVPGEVHGEIDRSQLDALAAELAQPSDKGTVLAFHHPPIGAPAVAWTRDIGLRNVDDLAHVITGSDVIAILCGHLHLQLTGPFAGTTVWATPGVVTRADLTAPAHRLRAVHGAGASVVEVTPGAPPTSYVLQARDPRAGEEVLVVDPYTWQVATED